MTRHRKIISGLLFGLGSLLLLLTIFPILFSLVRFQFFSPPKLIDPTVVSVYPAPYIVNVFGTATADYTNPEIWFNTSYPASASASSVTHYNLSIPQIQLLDVPIEINGLDLKNSAIHYAGTALPGSFGNTVIFGHSALPLFYKPGNPLTIFNPLIKIKVGDDISINYDNLVYRYRVRQTMEVTPDKISVLAQRFDRHELTLITCVPLGTYWHRFVAVADLVN